MIPIPEQSNWRYCPVCGQRLELTTLDNQQVPRCTSQTCGFIFWQNAKPCVAALIVDESRQVLMTKRAIEPDLGKLDLPGGFLHQNEEPATGLKREIREELNVEIEVGEVVGHFVDAYGQANHLNLVIGFLAKILSGQLRPQEEVSEIEWVPQNISAERLAFTNNARFMQTLQKLL